MKIKFLTFTLFISFNFPVLGAGRLCNNLKNDLIALEYKMQTDSLFECGEEGASEGSCCRPSIPETCITRKEAEANYNDIIAKLNLAKGMQAMGMTVEGHHNAFVDLEEKDLNDAIKAAENFNLSFTKADLIYSMMEFKDDTSIISGFQNYLDAHIAGLPMVEKAFVNEEDVLTEYLTTKCGFGESTPFVDSDFCKQYIGILNQDSKDPNALKLTDDQRDESDKYLI